MNAPPPSSASAAEKKKGSFGQIIVFSKNDCIGGGQFGRVYKGFNRETRGDVAIKVFQDMQATSSTMSQNPSACGLADDDGHHPQQKREQQQQRSYPSEIQVLMKLKTIACPNILYVDSCWTKRSENSPKFILVSEHCAGGDLRKCLQKHKGPLDETLARSLIYQLANALLVLKSQFIIHRDIKPANLLLTSGDLDKAVLKVADFGMAKEAASKASHEIRDDDMEHTFESVLFASELGTPMYMSPERNQRLPYSFKADVYSAGLVLYEMMVGHPVRAGSRGHLLTAVPDAVRHERERFTSINADVPQWLTLVEGMTEKHPARRFSIEQVLRHAWFDHDAAHPLPALTVPLPPQPPSPPQPSATETEEPPATKEVERGTDVEAPPGQQQDTPPVKSEDEEQEEEGTAPSAPWTVQGEEGSNVPRGCGLHIITNAVRNFVDVVLFYAYHEEVDVMHGLSVLAYLMETVQSGYICFEKEVEQLGRGGGSGSGSIQEDTYRPLRAMWERMFRRLRDLARERRSCLLQGGNNMSTHGKPFQQIMGTLEDDEMVERVMEEEPHEASRPSSPPPPPPPGSLLVFRRAMKLIERSAVSELTQLGGGGDDDGYVKALALLRVLTREAVLSTSEMGLLNGGVTTSRLLYLVHVPVYQSLVSQADMATVRRVIKKLSDHVRQRG